MRMPCSGERDCVIASKRVARGEAIVKETFPAPAGAMVAAVFLLVARFLAVKLDSFSGEASTWAQDFEMNMRLSGNIWCRWFDISPAPSRPGQQALRKTLCRDHEKHWCVPGRSGDHKEGYAKPGRPIANKKLKSLPGQ